ncbi:uncharacterized protein LOC111262842 isoform X2 [Varroa jacobsoni]|uniref:uncharacterized protein LOC111262842 isoform X2 n=1 Tax=Varroa jacobsoni TaxID=62625 RepID=UPI000BFA7AF9|nr:uncharacterized protein LOC111262842 isoform X2 [Varroa jacobsoni]
MQDYNPVFKEIKEDSHSRQRNRAQLRTSICVVNFPKELQRMVAELFGKEDALFFPSGTMANICATMTHCKQRGDEILCGDMCHIFLNEQGGASSLGGLSINPAPTQDDGRILISDFERRLRPHENVCTPRTALLCLENTHNFMGGVVLNCDYMKQIGNFAKVNRLPLHLDGARILNASTYLHCAPSELTKNADSVMMCISKGLGAPIGSLLAGTKDFCKGARRIRKVLGGGLRQVGIAAAAGIVALNTTYKGLYKDHEKNYAFAQKLAPFDNDIFSIDLTKVQTNMTILHMKNGYNPVQFCELVDTTAERATECDEKSMIFDKDLTIAAEYAAYVAFRQFKLDRKDVLLRVIGGLVMNCQYLKYRIFADFMPSNCTKNETHFYSLDECVAMPGAPIRSCKIDMFVQRHGPSRLVTYDCHEEQPHPEWKSKEFNDYRRDTDEWLAKHCVIKCHDNQRLQTTSQPHYLYEDHPAFTASAGMTPWFFLFCAILPIAGLIILYRIW